MKRSPASAGHDNRAGKQAAVWTVDDDEVSISVEPKSDVVNKNRSQNDDDDDDDDDQRSRSSANSDDDEAESFDYTIVPEGAILRRNDVVPLDAPSEARITRKARGINSYERRLDDDEDELWRYFMTYLNEKPQMTISIVGSHKVVSRSHS